MIKYPEKFIKECKEVYPKWTALYEALEKGSEFVGRYLNDSSFETISVEDIISIKDMDSLNKLKERALRIKTKKELYDKWYKMYRQNINED
ncbi:hypothetical protein KYB31_05505 [Clostridium felsineum]|uniref:hypothetical protein n=1 Tax=Clostridium felsineum TaxID=36839 RepID=UPI00214D1541|nr:hypothetical protein [Clostridium felsineum]MCR3758451.1 hypothetical protein [Clostridium felsineum]